MPKSLTLAVQVPQERASSLSDLTSSLGQGTVAGETHPFDGETFAQVVILLTGGGLPALKAWLDARVAARQRFRVVYDGTEYEGYSAAEVAKLVAALRADVDEE